MPALSGLTFTAPWVLAALAVLPVIWWLLRITPPAPKTVLSSAVALFGRAGEEETPAETPPWLLLLRLALAALVILALAGPLLNPATGPVGSGPLVIVIDDGWAAAHRWQRRLAALDDLVTTAERDGRPVALVPTAPGPAKETLDRLLPAAEVRATAAALKPKPWPVDRARALKAVAALGLNGAARIAWLADGIAGDFPDFAQSLRRLGRLTVYRDPPGDGVVALRPPEAEIGALRVVALRSEGTLAARRWLRAQDEKGALLAREPLTFAGGATEAAAAIEVPTEVRNRIVRLDVENEASAGAVVLLDERWRRRPVGLVGSGPIERAQPLLSETYYLERALAPFAEVREGEIGALLARPLAVLVLADVAKLLDQDRTAVETWMKAGGVLVRFAGPKLAAGADDLVPVRLRGGGRVLGGVMSWSQPARLAPFDPASPFAGIPVPDDVRVRRQVLAEPSLDLARKTWARLTDGTPLVTAARRGRGWLVLFHTTANTAWSDLALSGLFVEMLQRIVELARGVAAEREAKSLPPLSTLDGFGRLGEPPSTARPIAGATLPAVGPDHPPGFYGSRTARRALNLTAGLTTLAALPALPQGVAVATIGEAHEIALRPWLLAAALGLALIDMLVGLALRGLVRVGAGATVLAALLIAGGSGPALAAGDDTFALAATLKTRLAYVRTGDPTVDEVSRAGLAGLSRVLAARTSFEPAPPMAVDPETDEMIFFPLIYWPVTPGFPPLSTAARARIDHYLRTGGIVVFDTRERDVGFGSFAEGGAGPGVQRLRLLLRGLDIPPLYPVPADHVLTRSFYLLRDFPGRWAGGEVWVERHEGGVNDGVSSLIIGSNDWAAAWAVNGQGRPMFPVVPGGERQREMAYRFGVNLVMYAMTGNYKADQVHLPAILQRLGQ